MKNRTIDFSEIDVSEISQRLKEVVHGNRQ